MIRRLPSTTRFPYTTLFRSDDVRERFSDGVNRRELTHDASVYDAYRQAVDELRGRDAEIRDVVPERELKRERSEEHTSELQSHVKLVCRLLLEKKKEEHHQI